MSIYAAPARNDSEDTYIADLDDLGMSLLNPVTKLFDEIVKPWLFRAGCDVNEQPIIACCGLS